MPLTRVSTHLTQVCSRPLIVFSIELKVGLAVQPKLASQ
jgi:hypothetical protein